MLSFVSSSMAFNAPMMVPHTAARAAMPTMAFIDSLEGTGEETGGVIWDPLDIAGSVGDEALMWFRASELKHGRVAMLATVGYLTGAAGITFPGELAKGVSFASVNAGGVFNAWSSVPEAGKLQVSPRRTRLEPRARPMRLQSTSRAAWHGLPWRRRLACARAREVLRGAPDASVEPHDTASQHLHPAESSPRATPRVPASHSRAALLPPLPWQILSIIFMLEVATESKKPHYMRGGVPGKIDQLPFDGIKGIWAPKIKFWDPLGFMGALTPAQKAKKRKAELKNGRLAMIGIISFLVGHNLPGAVPALTSAF
jgi:hypothetical protein